MRSSFELPFSSQYLFCSFSFLKHPLNTPPLNTFCTSLKHYHPLIWSFKMRRQSLLPFLCAILPAANAFRFIDPEGPTLDLSKPIHVSWDLRGGASDDLARSYQIVFVAASESVVWDYNVTSFNISTSQTTGSYTWDPSDDFGPDSNNTQQLEGGPLPLHFFEARFIAADGFKLGSTWSKKYFITGVPNITGSGSGGRFVVSGAAIGLAAGIAALNIFAL
ncbi:hypothetical protein F5X68DRAFT_210938 [Plectosphaerella plurivora]|uniref:Uncharacterized protein n=1 Tax=Plectosphaerella plurivora TaxID=936078 RepID=A0A9P9AA01_9PEZI|nr:hypothetical protein F5X68DRAFT_210938 [Plectosphaerella plurivora]